MEGERYEMRANELLVILVIAQIIAAGIMLGSYHNDLEKRDTIIREQKAELEQCHKDIDSWKGRVNQLQSDVDLLIQELEEKERHIGAAATHGKVITCEVSAYSSGDSLTPSSVMANGDVAHVGAVACNFLPIGTQVRIDGNVYTVKDRCGIDNCIDIYMETTEECLRFGRRMMEVEIL